jgi:hypothetical protein
MCKCTFFFSKIGAFRLFLVVVVFYSFDSTGIWMQGLTRLY